jgi:hypothetical protein
MISFRARIPVRRISRCYIRGMVATTRVRTFCRRVSYLERKNSNTICETIILPFVLHGYQTCFFHPEGISEVVSIWEQDTKENIWI